MNIKISERRIIKIKKPCRRGYTGKENKMSDRNEVLQLKEENKQLEADLAKAMDAIIDTCDHCGWNGETCVNNECRFYEFYKDRKEKS